MIPQIVNEAFTHRFVELVKEAAKPQFNKTELRIFNQLKNKQRSTVPRAYRAKYKAWQRGTVVTPQEQAAQQAMMDKREQKYIAENRPQWRARELLQKGGLSRTEALAGVLSGDTFGAKAQMKAPELARTATKAGLNEVNKQLPGIVHKAIVSAKKEVPALKSLSGLGNFNGLWKKIPTWLKAVGGIGAGGLGIWGLSRLFGGGNQPRGYYPNPAVQQQQGYQTPIQSTKYNPYGSQYGAQGYYEGK